MGKRRRRLTGPAALSAIAAASLVGAPSASAQEVCVICEPGTPAGQINALLKHAELGFPGETFWKWNKAPFYKEAGTALLKITEIGFPGNTGEVFFKDR